MKNIDYLVLQPHGVHRCHNRYKGRRHLFVNMLLDKNQLSIR